MRPSNPLDSAIRSQMELKSPPAGKVCITVFKSYPRGPSTWQVPETCTGLN